MPYYRFEGEKTLNEIIRKAYRIESGGPTLASIGERLAQANPHLDLTGRSLSRKIAIGAMIDTPPVEGVRLAPTTSTLRESAVDALPTDTVIDMVRNAIEFSNAAETERMKECLNGMEQAATETQDPNELMPLNRYVEGIRYQLHAHEVNASLEIETVDKAADALDSWQELLKYAHFRP